VVTKQAKHDTAKFMVGNMTGDFTGRQAQRAHDPAKNRHVPANRIATSAKSQRYPESQSAGVVPAARSSSSLSQVISIVPVRAAVAA
jgi:hypothetical protein